MVAQEALRKSGYSIQPEEEKLRQDTRTLLQNVVMLVYWKYHQKALSPSTFLYMIVLRDKDNLEQKIIFLKLCDSQNGHS